MSVDRRTAIRLSAGALFTTVAASEFQIIPGLQTPQAEAKPIEAPKSQENNIGEYHLDSFGGSIAILTPKSGERIVAVARPYRGRMGQIAMAPEGAPLPKEQDGKSYDPGVILANKRGGNHALISESGGRVLAATQNFEGYRLIGLHKPVATENSAALTSDNKLLVRGTDNKHQLVDLADGKITVIERTGAEQQAYSSYSEPRANDGVYRFVAGFEGGLRVVTLNPNTKTERSEAKALPGHSGAVEVLKNSVGQGEQEVLLVSGGRKVFVTNPNNPEEQRRAPIELAGSYGNDAKIIDAEINKHNGEVYISVFSQGQTTIETVRPDGSRTFAKTFRDGTGKKDLPLKKPTSIEIQYDPNENQRPYLVFRGGDQLAYAADAKADTEAEVVPFNNISGVIPAAPQPGQPTPTPRTGEPTPRPEEPTPTPVEPTPVSPTATPVVINQDFKVIDASAKAGKLAAIVEKSGQRLLTEEENGKLRTLAELPLHFHTLKIGRPSDYLVMGNKQVTSNTVEAYLRRYQSGTNRGEIRPGIGYPREAAFSADSTKLLVNLRVQEGSRYLYFDELSPMPYQELSTDNDQDTLHGWLASQDLVTVGSNLAFVGQRLEESNNQYVVSEMNISPNEGSSGVVRRNDRGQYPTSWTVLGKVARSENYWLHVTAANHEQDIRIKNFQVYGASGFGEKDSHPFDGTAGPFAVDESSGLLYGLTDSFIQYDLANRRVMRADLGQGGLPAYILEILSPDRVGGNRLAVVGSNSISDENYFIRTKDLSNPQSAWQTVTLV